jgi:hypothetical protein
MQLAVLLARECEHEVHIAAHANEGEAVGESLFDGWRVAAERAQWDCLAGACTLGRVYRGQESRVITPEQGRKTEGEVQIVGYKEDQVDTRHLEDLVYPPDDYPSDGY